MWFQYPLTCSNINLNLFESGSLHPDGILNCRSAAATAKMNYDPIVLPLFHKVLGQNLLSRAKGYRGSLASNVVLKLRFFFKSLPKFSLPFAINDKTKPVITTLLKLCPLTVQDSVSLFWKAEDVKIFPPPLRCIYCVYSSTPSLSVYFIASPTEVSFLHPHQESRCQTLPIPIMSSTMSRESAPRSSTKDASGTIWLSSTSSLSMIISSDGQYFVFLHSLSPLPNS